MLFTPVSRRTPDPQPADAMAGAIAVAARQRASVYSAGESLSAMSRRARVAVPAGSGGAPSRLLPEANLDALWAELDLLDDLWPGRLRRDG